MTKRAKPANPAQPNETAVPEKMRMCAELRFANPGATWDEIGEMVGVSRVTTWRWRSTEAWEIVSREVASRYVADLAADAVAALRTAWKKGNPTGALDVLRALALLRGQEVTVNHHLDRDLDAEIEKLLGAALHAR